MFWSGSLSRDISAVANLMPSLEFDGDQQIDVSHRVQPSISSAIIHLAETMSGRRYLPKNVLKHAAYVSHAGESFSMK